MYRFRIPLIIGAVSFACTLVACGSGGSADTTPQLATAALFGMVVEVDGQTLDRSGIAVRVVETDDRTVTGADGRFFFDSVPAAGATLEISDSRALLASGAASDDGLVEVRCSLRDGVIVEDSSRSDGRVRARNRLIPTTGNPFGSLEGYVETERRTDREKFKIEAEHLPAGTIVEFFLDRDDGSGFRTIGSARAAIDGEAQIELSTHDGDTLPFGVASLDDLDGAAVEVRLASDGAPLLTGTVPGLPDSLPATGDAPAAGGRARSRGRLMDHVANAEGDVELRRGSDPSEQEFRMEAELGVAGVIVFFQIEDSVNPGAWIPIATRVTGSDGEAEYKAETRDGETLPLGVGDVADLVGRLVRVTQDSADGELLLSGTIPPLVAD